MRRFAKTYAASLFLMGLLLILCMGCPIGMVLLVVLEGRPFLFWTLAAFLPAIPSLAWLAWRGGVLEKARESMKNKNL